LHEMGFTVAIEAENGRHLIDQLEQAASLPDLCMLDINMPVMNGIAAAKEIKQKWPHLPILGFSLSLDDNEIKNILFNGADAYINKDCNPNELESTLLKLYAERKHVILTDSNTIVEPS